MGGRLSCCAAPATPRVAPRPKRSKRERTKRGSRSSSLNPSVVLVDHPVPAPAAASPSSLLQHISEREPDDVDGDPSTNPRTGTLFMQRSRSDMRSE